MKLNPPETKIKLTKELIKIFINYLRGCSYDGFAFGGQNNFRKFEPVREALLFYTVNSIIEQITYKFYKSMHESESKVITLKLNYAERITLSVLFKRVEIPKELAPLELQVLNKLIIERK